MPYETPRASRLPVLKHCLRANERDAAAPPLASDTPATRLGHAVHNALAMWNECGIMQPDPFLISVDPDERGEAVGMMLNGERMTNELLAGRAIANNEVERKMEIAGILTGSADRMWTEDHSDIVNLLDYKTGWKDHDYSEQCLGYALLGSRRHPRATRFVAHILWLRFGTVETLTFERRELDDLFEWLTEAVAKGATGTLGGYTDGPHCSRCPRQRSCPALQHLARGLMEGTLALRPETYEEMSPPEKAATLQRVYAAAQQGEKLIEAAKAWVRDQLRGGPMPLADGRELTLLTMERREIIPAKARKALGLPPTTGLIQSDDDFNSVFRVSVGGLESVIRSRTTAGSKAQAVAQFMVDLERDGAIEASKRELVQVVDPLKKALKEKKSNG